MKKEIGIGIGKERREKMIHCLVLVLLVFTEKRRYGDISSYGIKRKVYSVKENATTRGERFSEIHENENLDG